MVLEANREKGTTMAKVLYTPEEVMAMELKNLQRKCNNRRIGRDRDLPKKGGK